MYASRIRAAGLVIAASLGLSACMSPYGYSSVGVGVGSGGYYGDYGYGYPYGSYGYGYPSYGWYDDFYYPGSGYYVYSRDGHRHRWTDAQRRYWESRHDRNRDGLRIRQRSADTSVSQPAQTTQSTQIRRSSERRPDRVERSQSRREGVRIRQQSRRDDRRDD
jgi:hypothetical protein